MEKNNLEIQIEGLRAAQKYIAEFKDRPLDAKYIAMALGSIIKALETIQEELKEIKENQNVNK